MATPLTDLPLAKYASYKEENQTTQITVLPSGVRVASENRFGQFCTVGGKFFFLNNKSVVLLNFYWNSFSFQSSEVLEHLFRLFFLLCGLVLDFFFKLLKY